MASWAIPKQEKIELDYAWYQITGTLKEEWKLGPQLA